MEKENIILQYISVWSWHIISVIFLVGAFVIVFSGTDMGNNVMFIVFLVMWVLCETIAFSRKKKLEAIDAENHPEENSEGAGSE